MTNPRTLFSPLRYPGSKRGLVDYISQAIELNTLRPSLYVEPFIGGGSVAINLLNRNLVEKVLMVDLDPWITSFWQTAFFDTQWLIDQVKTMQVSMENWHAYKKSKPTTIRDQALTCLFLNRTSFSGILEERAGPIGGKGQESDYPIDCRFTEKTRKTIIDRIVKISQYQHRIYGIWNCSWECAIRKIKVDQDNGKSPKSNLFLYLDPPFFEKASSLYRFYFLEEDHKALRDFLISLEDKWLLSYDSASQVEALYGDALKKGTNGTQHHDIELLYTVARISKRKRGKEVIISNLERLPALPAINPNGNNEEK